MKDIKETKELFAGLALIAKAAKKIAADGKVSLADAEHIIDLAKESSVIVAAFKDLKEVPAELKDLDKEELIDLVLTVYKAVGEVEAV
jgi:type III secretion system FlhB-like substrate exporter